MVGDLRFWGCMCVWVVRAVDILVGCVDIWRMV